MLARCKWNSHTTLASHSWIGLLILATLPMIKMTLCIALPLGVTYSAHCMYGFQYLMIS